MGNVATRDAALIVGANAIPVLGVLFAGWDTFTLLLLFWFESAVIGFWVCIAVTIGRQEMLTIAESKAAKGSMSLRPGIGAGLFIAAHAGIFMAVHLFFLVGFREMSGGGFDIGTIIPVQLIERGLWLPLAGLFVLRGLITVSDHAAGRPLEPTIIGFYVRIILMQIAIIIGGFFVMLAGGTLAPLILLIVLRAAIDLGIEPIVDRLGLRSPAASADAS